MYDYLYILDAKESFVIFTIFTEGFYEAKA